MAKTCPCFSVAPIQSSSASMGRFGDGGRGGRGGRGYGGRGQRSGPRPGKRLNRYGNNNTTVPNYRGGETENADQGGNSAENDYVASKLERMVQTAHVDDQMDKKFGFEKYTTGPERLGWLYVGLFCCCFAVCESLFICVCMHFAQWRMVVV